MNPSLNVLLSSYHGIDMLALPTVSHVNPNLFFVAQYRLILANIGLKSVPIVSVIKVYF